MKYAFRVIATALFVVAAWVFILGVPRAVAAPSLCDDHGTGPGLIYKAACGEPTDSDKPVRRGEGEAKQDRG